MPDLRDDSPQPKRQSTEATLPRPTLRTHGGGTARLQIEMLEKRDVPTAVVDTPVDLTPAEAASGVLQASQMSAFFQQSALFATGQPTSDPTVTWQPRYIIPVAEMMRGAPPVSSSQMSTLAEQMAEGPGERGGLLPLRPGSGIAGRASTGRRLDLFVDETWPSQVYAPYVEVDAATPFDLEDALIARGIKYFNLAFVTADADGQASWSGKRQQAIDGGPFDLAVRRQVREVRALGGHVAVSFGGPKGTELAAAITNIDDLTAAYRGVIEAYDLHRVDFDLQGVALDDTGAIERRNEALGRLQDEFAARGEKLDVWFTLSATPQGLDKAAVDMLRSAVRHGVHVGGVNLRPSGYPDQPASESAGKMGLYSIQAAINVVDQLQQTLPADETAVDVWSKIGLTPSVGTSADGQRYGRNDVQAIRDFARDEAMGMVGLWSLNGDSPSPASAERQPEGHGSPPASDEAVDFSEILRSVTGSAK